jgi:hypothetical protein
LVLDVPVLIVLGIPQIPDFFALVLAAEEEKACVAVDTGPPRLIQMCEWMASTAAPVRGPNVRA